MRAWQLVAISYAARVHAADSKNYTPHQTRTGTDRESTMPNDRVREWRSPIRDDDVWMTAAHHSNVRCPTRLRRNNGIEIRDRPRSRADAHRKASTPRTR